MKRWQRIFHTYRYLMGTLWEGAPGIVIGVLVLAVVQGLLTPLGVLINSRILDDGLLVASGQADFASLIPILALFVVTSLLPSLLDHYKWSYAEPRCLLVLRTSFRARMLKKIKRMKYEHLESKESMEVIDKAYMRTENAARHLFPMYLSTTIISLISVIGILVYLVQVRWWLALTVLAPYFIELFFSSGLNHNIYEELEGYWDQERQYGILGGFLKSRDAVRENKLLGASDYLIGTYRKRLNSRNREYERFFLKHIKQVLTLGNLSRIASIGNVLLLLMLYLNGQMSIGLMVSLSLQVFGAVYGYLNRGTVIPRFGHFHFNSFDYYEKYFDLSEEETSDSACAPQDGTIEFRDVWFRYPGTDRDILKGLTFHVEDGEKISIVGENGEGKTTMVKLLLGLFTPDKGQILVGGCPLNELDAKARTDLFGAVFQDFMRYSIPLKENVAVGNIEKQDDTAALNDVMELTGVKEFASRLPQGTDTLLGREFEGGVDLSGGQWQRIAMARAFLGDKSILILDEPTSQLDPMAESRLYGEFAQMADGKTSLFITHRLGSTAITDRILVISGGTVVQTGTHEQLLDAGGLYAEMFDAQKSWYDQTGAKEAAAHA